jgi:hypothetical protein
VVDKPGVLVRDGVLLFGSVDWVPVPPGGVPVVTSKCDERIGSDPATIITQMIKLNIGLPFKYFMQPYINIFIS